jgi:hypothetical protein
MTHPCRLRFARDPHEGAEIGKGGGMARIGGERHAHRSLGVLDSALGVAREPVIDPGVGPARVQLDRGGEGLFGALSLAERRKSLAVGVMRRREFRGAPAGFARGDQRGLIVADREMRDGGVPERRGIVCARGLRFLEAGDRLGMPPRGLQGDAELKLGLGVARLQLKGAAQVLDRRGKVVRAQRFEPAANEPIGFIQRSTRRLTPGALRAPFLLREAGEGKSRQKEGKSKLFPSANRAFSKGCAGP